jgi:hypothetical protein
MNSVWRGKCRIDVVNKVVEQHKRDPNHGLGLSTDFAAHVKRIAM